MKPLDVESLPAYQSHKVVRAVKIKEITPAPGGGAIITPDLRSRFKVSHLYVGKHKPTVGGYFVQYKDGYQSSSPAEAFENGYAKVKGGKADNSKDKLEKANDDLKAANLKIKEYEKLVKDIPTAKQIEIDENNRKLVFISKVAETCHEVNKTYCESLGDKSQKPWAKAPKWQKDSAINGVMFHMDNPEASASASHDSWMKEKVDGGWKLGDKKDEKAKTHPCIVPFEDLPKEQQYKDFLFKTVVKSLATD
jgi:hypothetical protein